MVIKSLALQLNTCIQLRVLKHPSRKVINFRHLLSCDAIVRLVRGELMITEEKLGKMTTF